MNRRTDPAAADDALLWQQAVADASPLAPDGRVHHAAAALPPVPRRRRQQAEAAPQAPLSDGLQVEALLDPATEASFRRPGIGADTLRKLRRGHWQVQAALDLHGLRRDDARDALLGFVREATGHGLRCVRVVHGKGLGSPGGEAVLQRLAQVWLVQIDAVLAFTRARVCDGGAGALLVLLRG